MGAMTSWGAAQALAQMKSTMKVEYTLGFDKMFVEANSEFEKQSELIEIIHPPLMKDPGDSSRSMRHRGITECLLWVAQRASNLGHIVASWPINDVASSFMAKEKNSKGQESYDDSSRNETFALLERISELENGTIRWLRSWAITGSWIRQVLDLSYGNQVTGNDKEKVALDPKSDDMANALPDRVGREGGMSDLAYDAPRDSSLSSPVLPSPDARTALYVIEAHTVYMPNGDKLEAHSGLGDRFDDSRYVHERNRGPTPPHVYDLELRRGLFHGVVALRLKPVGDGKMFGRVGMLAHNYMLGQRGDSHGCVVFRDYARFLAAFKSGEVTRLVVVAGAGESSSRIASRR